MKKLLSSVGLAISVAAVTLLAGCQLYFGDHSSSSGPSGPGNGSASGSGMAPGSECSMDKQCAAGCFCADGVCTEGGFCGVDKDCGAGFHCDTTRASCIPNPQCTSNDQCEPGAMCDNTADAGCVKTCSCAADAEAIKQGFGWCDEPRSTCMPGTDPAGACTGAVTCTAVAPACPEGQVALIKDGCFAGGCRDIATCEAAPACGSLQHEVDCTSRSTDCSVVKTGHGCRGTDCGTTNLDCTCDSYTFDSCEDQGPAAVRLLIAD